jgi:hypothetical protein
MTDTAQHKIRVAGVVCTLIITAFLSWTGYFIFFKTDEVIYSAQQIKQNQHAAFKHISLVSKAQAEYIKYDHDKNGKLEYARFITHLWRTIGKDNERVQLDLIPKTLAFAIKRTRACDGYYFVHQFKKVNSSDGIEVDMDPEEEWAVMMIPAAEHTGYVTFFANQSGNIYANDTRTRMNIPNDPESDDSWKLVKDPRDLKALQQANP